MQVIFKDLNFQKRCSHCKWMKSHPGYAYRLFNTRHFEPQTGMESIVDVVAAFNCRINMNTIYLCLKKHHAQMKGKPAIRVGKDGKILVDKNYITTQDLINSPDGIIHTHEIALDEIIQEGRNLLASGQMVITAQHLIAAAKTKADIEKSNKDRKLDLLKSMFTGAAPGHNGTN